MICVLPRTPLQGPQKWIMSPKIIMPDIKGGTLTRQFCNFRNLRFFGIFWGHEPMRIHSHGSCIHHEGSCTKVQCTGLDAVALKISELLHKNSVIFPSICKVHTFSGPGCPIRHFVKFHSFTKNPQNSLTLPIPISNLRPGAREIILIFREPLWNFNKHYS